MFSYFRLGGLSRHPTGVQYSQRSDGGEKKPEKLSPCGSRGDITAVAVEKLARRTDLREPRDITAVAVERRARRIELLREPRRHRCTGNEIVPILLE
ncbi:hypothetical protein DPX16_0660 [Anabarilius grahami]|uniref:Uncharacterized protein n=1 Tax=Anabarilius grahami TaxID=495550 RepID=A0A3N0YFB2_ANAGA|nr:hypothetical protein DPX16_0660 [Anabarilius grahami]